MLCEMMGVSRSGFYKWMSRDDTERVMTRRKVAEIVAEVHEHHPSHGYRWVKHYIAIHYYVDYSYNYVYKAFQYLGIRAKTKHRKKQNKRTVKDRFPNLIFTTWETVDRPRQVIVSDMTAFTVLEVYYELTFYFDVFTKEILTWKLTDKRGDRNQYIDGLRDIVELLDGLENKEPTIIHTDQGSVYASKAYNDLIIDKNIQRSMSRAGKPTDNPVNESLNGWIKEELEIDFHLRKSSDVRATIEEYVYFYNNERPCYSIGYDTPANYYRRFCNGEIEKKDTFENRVLSEEPKFVKKRKADAAYKVASD